MNDRSAAEKMLLVLCAFAVIAISPFIYMRWIDGDTVMALIDAFIVLVMSVFFVFFYRNKKVAIAKIIFASFLAIVIVVTVDLRGQPHLYWLYPAMIAFYYILSARAAGVICFIAITCIAIIIFKSTSALELLTITFTLSLTAGFAYVIFNNHSKTNQKLALLASVDPLTSSGNRRALNKKLVKVLADQERAASDISLFLLDVDHFKKVNDNYGHAKGDQVLIELVELIKSHTRALDSLYRYGGEEFIVLPLSVNLLAAKVIAEKLRKKVAETTFSNGILVTISIGVAQYRAEETAESWISRADTALYLAKNGGRNQVVTEQAIGTENKA